MHTYFKDYIVHHYRICVRYMGTVPSNILINKFTVRYLYRAVKYKNGLRVAIIISQGDIPKTLYFLNLKNI
jgi:hypothetical protein